MAEILRSSLLVAVALLFLPESGRAQEARGPLVVVDVPFLAQTEDLCGGAAAAMVLRYWGVTDIQSEDFAPLVDRAKGGISTGDLVHALTSRGVLVRPISAESSDILREITSGRPVIALIDAGGGGRLHYVVIVGWASAQVLFHDPSVGPFRVKTELDFLRLWRATGGFALVVTPGTSVPAAPAPPVPTALPRGTTPCDPLVNQAIGVARGSDPESAVPPLLAATQMCPGDARALSALAGLRFRQERWKEAVEFARRATERGAVDAEAWRLLGASLFLSDEPRSALDAWNRIEEPRLDRVQIEGLVRTRQDVATAVLGLRPRDVLTRRSLALAQRRLAQLPTAIGSKVTYRPLPNGRADVVVSVGETGFIDPWRILVFRLAVEAVAKREGRLRINSPTGRGEGIELGGRFAARRPSLWASIETPRLGGLPGVVSLSGLWDRQTYRPDATGGVPVTVETRRRGAIDWSHWPVDWARLDLGFGMDRFDGRGNYVSIRGGIETRMAKDRVAIFGDVASWLAGGEAAGFSELRGTVVLRTSVRPRRFLIHGRLGARRATSESPLAVWPGAGTGPGRDLLLRASPLVKDGELVGDAFGRSLLHATAEAEVTIADRGAVRLGVAAFGDWARSSDTIFQPGPGRPIFAFGVGLRLQLPSQTALRIDVAKRPDRAGVVLSAGVIPAWPR